MAGGQPLCPSRKPELHRLLRRGDGHQPFDNPGHVTGGPGHRSGVRAALRHLPGCRQLRTTRTSTSPQTSVTAHPGAGKGSGRVDAQLVCATRRSSGQRACVRGVQAAFFEWCDRGPASAGDRAAAVDPTGRGGVRPRGLGPAVGRRGGCSPVVGEESDAGKGHLDAVAMWSTLRLAWART